MNTIYKETIGNATIELIKFGDAYIARMDEDGKHYERQFNPSPYPERDPYALALAMYDNTVTALQKKYNTTVTLGKPDFIEAVK